MWRSWRSPQWWATGSQEGCRARTQDVVPQQGWQSRPRGGCREVVEVWPTMAGYNIPDRLDRWRQQQAPSPERTGRRGARTPCSQASGEAWIPVLTDEPWSASDPQLLAAVAAAGPIGDPTPWWPTEGLTTSEPSPGECLRGVAASIVQSPKYVQL